MENFSSYLKEMKSVFIIKTSLLTVFRETIAVFLGIIRSTHINKICEKM